MISHLTTCIDALNVAFTENNSSLSWFINHCYPSNLLTVRTEGIMLELLQFNKEKFLSTCWTVSVLLCVYLYIPTGLSAAYHWCSPDSHPPLCVLFIFFNAGGEMEVRDTVLTPLEWYTQNTHQRHTELLVSIFPFVCPKMQVEIAEQLSPLHLQLRLSDPHLLMDWLHFDMSYSR